MIRLYLITPPSGDPAPAVEAALAVLPRGSAGIQLRHPGEPARALLAHARTLAIIFGLLAVLAARSAYAQIGGAANVSGAITDDSGAALPTPDRSLLKSGAAATKSEAFDF